MRRFDLPAVRPALLVALLLSVTAERAAAQTLPVARLYSLFPAGAKQGTTLDLTIGGADLEDVHELRFTNPGITAVQKTQDPGLGQQGPQPVAGQFTVTVAADAPAGIGEVRVVGKYGVSNPRAFVIGTRDELSETEPNNALAQAQAVPLGAILNGQSNGANDQDFFKFTAQAGQRIIIDCWAHRIDSRMDPSLVLYDANGVELDRSRDVNRRDPLIDFTAPADGEYVVEVHDFLFAGNAEYFYRLHIGADAYLDFVYPPAGLPGSNETYTLYGRNLPGGTPTELKTADGKPLESLAVQIALPADERAQRLDFEGLVEQEESAVDGFAYQLATPAGLSNPVLIGYASAPVVLEQEPNDQPAAPQQVVPPCEYVGRFDRVADRDWIALDAKQGQVLWIEVISQRLGLPTDPHLLVQQVTRNEQGEEQVKELASVDDYLDSPQAQVRRGMFIYDMRTADPAYRFVAPADGTYRVLVRDMAQHQRADPRYMYRLAIRPERPDFRLVAKPRLIPISNDPNVNHPTVWNALVRKGGTELIDVVAFRRDGFNGPIEVSAEGLPAGVSAAPITIAAGETVGQLVLVAAEDAPAGVGLLQITGRADVAGQAVAHPARYATMVWSGQNNVLTSRSRLARDLAVAVSAGETAPFHVEVTGPLETSKAGKVELPIKVVRRGDFKGAVALAPFPVPPNVKPAALTLDENTAEGKLAFEVAGNTPAGTYSFTVVATSQVNYARNPEAVAEAQARKEAVDKIAAELTADAAAKATAKTEAEQRAAAATTAAMQAATVAEAAAKELAAAQAKAQAAAEAMAQAAADAQAAVAAQAEAEKQAAAVEAQAKQAVEVQKAVEKQLADATKAAAPKAIGVAAPSPAVTLKVAAAPIQLEPAGEVSASAGSTVELPIKLTRLYGFADAVQIAVQTSSDKIKVANLTVPADQTEFKLPVEVAADAAPAVYSLTIKASVKFNGQDLSIDSSQPLTVTAAEVAQSP